MPVYCYRCPDCGIDFEKRHSMNTVQDKCVECGSLKIFKIPSLSNTKSPSSAPSKPGKIVSTYIKDAKLEIKKHKQQLRSEEY